VLKTFRHGKSHMAIVQDVLEVLGKDNVYVTKGIVTLEDVIEEMLGAEIEDETDMQDRQHRDVDLVRLLTLIGPQHGLSVTDRVDIVEANLIANFLLDNYPQLHELMGPSMGSKGDHTKRMIDFVRSCPVLTLNEKEASSGSEYLYRRFKVATAGTLILHGKVTMHSCQF
jgi:hypothetical protein